MNIWVIRITIFDNILRIYLYIMQNALVVYICEVMIDIIKHSFISKFNGLKPTAFSEFLEDLCKQVTFSVNRSYLCISTTL